MFMIGTLPGLTRSAAFEPAKSTRSDGAKCTIDKQKAIERMSMCRLCFKPATYFQKDEADNQTLLSGIKPRKQHMHVHTETMKGMMNLGYLNHIPST